MATPLASTRSLVCAFLAVIFFLSSSLFAQPAVSPILPPEGTPIRSVTVIGNETVSSAEILRGMQLRAGGTFSADSYRRDLETLSLIRQLDPLQLRIVWERDTDGPLLLTVAVRENPRVRRIEIIGNSRFNRRQLIGQLDFNEGDILPTGARASIVRSLTNFYSNGGFKDARVRVAIDQVPNETELVDVRITVDERERIRIRALRLEGNTHFSNLYLRTRLNNAPGILFFRNFFDENAVEEDLAVLRQLYRNAGFLDAEVTRGEFIYDEERQHLTLVYNVVQGPRYRISDVEVEGVSLFTKREVDRAVDRLRGRTFNGRRVAQAQTRLQDLFGNEGFIDTEVSFRLRRNPEAATAVVIFEVRESAMSFVGDIVIELEDFAFDTDVNLFNQFMDWFSPPVREEAVRRELRLQSGEVYRRSDEIRTEERLRNLGIFRRVEILRDQSVDPEVKDVLIRLEEDPAAAFLAVTAGVGEVTGPSVTFRVVQPNFRGNADVVSASATIGTDFQAYRLSYFDRYLGDSETSGEFGIFRSTERFRAYRQTSTGADVELGRPLRERITGFLRFRAEYVEFSRFSRDAEEDFSDYPVFTARPMVVYDGRDNRFRPTRGQLISGGFETGVADGFLFKLLHAYEYYQTLGRTDFVYAYQHTVGLMPYDSRNVGISERFFVGGTNSLRGFRFREVGERDRGDDRLVIGGSTRLTQRHELRYPLTDFLMARVFTDIAILERGFLDIANPRAGSGVGVMFDLGPVTAEVDFARPILRESGDRAQFFHLRLGSRF